ncbi:MAG TPA: aspartate carbamoyltransferase catalytic subunit [Rhodanobacteraceae bacterium]|nr:aspartate carbamoyltransferase catalytic subunit [Rhodanobacteraceae bacterium]
MRRIESPAPAFPQVDDAGRLRHLITLEGLDRSRLTGLLDLAADLRARCRAGARRLPLIEDRTIISLFCEPSTRTRVSFELAARRLGAQQLDLDMAGSSTIKGEQLADTLATLEAMDCDVFVVRHGENGVPARLAAHTRRAAVINAGDGNHAHPTQGLLDLLTIRDRKGRIDGLTVVICGDIRHSRVARSDVHGLVALGVGEVRLCGPPPLLPATGEFADCRIFDDFDQALPGADVVIMLRQQKERMEATAGLDADDYFRRYGLDPARLARARPDALVMHPGPMNRGIEIASEVADGAQSAVLEQVANGIFVRMAVLVALLGEGGR